MAARSSSLIPYCCITLRRSSLVGISPSASPSLPLSLPPCLGCLETLISLRDSESATTGVLSSSSSSHSDRVGARRADRNNFWFVVGQFADLGTLLR